MSPRSMKAWSWVHRWSSLVCMAFALMLCMTGLPLIFHDEIDAIFDDAPLLATVAPDTPRRTLEDAIATAVGAYRGERPLYLSFDDDRPVVNVTTGPTADARRDQMHLTAIDKRTAAIVGELKDEGVMHVLLRLHVDLFADLPGMLFLGLMGFLFLVATVSGVVLYAPFMRRLPFGTLRTTRGRRAAWLDWHNLLGISTVTWVGVVGMTGVINTLSDPLVDVWRSNQLAELTAPYAGRPIPERWVPLDAAMATALAAAPGTAPQFVAFPGVRFSTNSHYAIWLRGGTPATERLLTPALVDAQTGELTAIRAMPWYMLVLRLAQPLHFGDYGGLPMRLLWAVLDVAAIVVLWSGLVLYVKRRRTARAASPGGRAPAVAAALVAPPGAARAPVGRPGRAE